MEGGAWRRWVWLFVGALQATHVSAEASRGDEIIDDLMRMERIAEYRLSADGARVAALLYTQKQGYEYRAGDPHAKSFDTRLIVIDPQSGAQREVSVEGHQPSGLSWSPNGRMLAFQAGDDDAARVWIWRADTGELLVLPQVRPRFLENGILWTADSRSIVLAVIPEGRSAVDLNRRAMSLSRDPSDYPLDRRIPGSSVAVYKSHADVAPETPKRGLTFLEIYETYVSDLALVDVESGQQRVIAKGFHPVRFRLSPDGRKLAFTHLKGTVNSSPERNVHAVYVVELGSSSPPRLLADSVHQSSRWMDLSWSPNGKFVAFFDSGVEARNVCYFHEVATGKVTVIRKPWLEGGESGLALNDGSSYRPPYWTKDSRRAIAFRPGPAGRALWLLDQRNASARRVETNLEQDIVQVFSDPDRVVASTLDEGVIVTARDRENNDEGLYVLDLEKGGFKKRDEHGGHFGSLGANADRSRILYSRQSADVPEQLWLSDRKSGAARKISSFNAKLTRHSFGTSRIVRWRDLNGKEKRGALLLPPDYDASRKYPLIVEIYGGSGLSAASNVFGFFRYPFAPPQNNRHILATRGYMVLLADTEARVGTPMFDIATSLLPGINALVDEGIVDENRLGIFGHSYGGYSTLSVLVSTARFKAAVVSAGSANLLQVYSTPVTRGANPHLGWAEDGQGRMGASLWDARSKYIENSPLFYFDRIRTPVLILHGTEDPTVQIQRGEEIYQSLLRLGKEVELAKYLGESHEVLGSANSLDYAYRMVEWFDRHLGGGKTASASALH